jgi:hypothetical protein
LYTQAELWLKAKNRRGFKGRHSCIIGFTKDVDYDIEFIGGIKTLLVVKDYFATLRGLNRLYTIIAFSRLLIESLLQHQELEETAAAKEVY